MATIRKDDVGATGTLNVGGTPVVGRVLSYKEADGPDDFDTVQFQPLPAEGARPFTLRVIEWEFEPHRPKVQAGWYEDPEFPVADNTCAPLYVDSTGKVWLGVPGDTPLAYVKPEDLKPLFTVN